MARISVWIKRTDKELADKLDIDLAATAKQVVLRTLQMAQLKAKEESKKWKKKSKKK